MSRTRKGALATALAVLMNACLGSALERHYPLGEPPPPRLAKAASKSGPVDELPSGLEAAAQQTTVHPDALQRASRYTAYSTTVTIGSGYQKRKRQYCDYVLLDSEGLIVGAYRLEQRC